MLVTFIVAVAKYSRKMFVWLIVVGKAWWKQCEVIAHIAATVRKMKMVMAGAQSTFSYLFLPSSQPVE